MEENKIPERAACLQVLNFSWEDVGVRVAAGWNMPAQVRLSMQASGVAGPPLDRSLASIVNYGHNLTRAVYRKGVAVNVVHFECPLDPAGQPTPISVRDLGRIVDSAVAETSGTFSSLHLSTDTLLLSKQADSARAILESSPLSSAAGISALTKPFNALIEQPSTKWTSTLLLSSRGSSMRCGPPGSTVQFSAS